MIKKCAKMSVFLCDNRKNLLVAGGYAPRPPVMDPSLPNPGCDTDTAYCCVDGTEMKNTN